MTAEPRGHPPKVTIINTKLFRSRMNGRERTRRSRALLKQAPRNDPLRCYPVWLPDSIANIIAAELKIAKHKVRPRTITEQEWRKLIGSIIAVIAKQALTKK